MPVSETICRAIRRALSLSQDTEITATLNLLDDLGADSFQIMAIVVAIETELHREFRPETFGGLATVQDLISAVQELTTEGNSGS